MKKNGLIILSLLIFCSFLSACTPQHEPAIKYERKLGKYLENNEPTGSTIDLSEGPKTNYNAKFGPKDLNFDMKIVNPY